MSQPSNKITAISNTEGEVFAVAGGQYRILVSGEATDGKYAIIEMNVPPGGGPPPHAHPKIEETFYVAEGELIFKTEDAQYTAKEGAFIRIPLGGGAHAFKNRSEKPAKLICTVVPAGLDSLFREISTAGPAQIPAISEKYAITGFPPNYLGDF